MYFRQVYIYIIIASFFTTSCQKLVNDPGGVDPIIEVDKGLSYWGGIYNDQGHAVVQTADGGYAVVGSQYSSTSQSDLILVKFSSSLEFEVKTNFGGTGDDSSYTNIANDIQQTDDGGYISVGTTFNGTDNDVWVIKFNSDLSTEWDTTVMVTTGYNDFGNSIQEMASGKYLICGTSYDGTNNDFDAMLWDITRDGATSTLLYTETGSTTYDYGNFAQQTSDGGYIIISTSAGSMNLTRLNSANGLVTSFGESASGVADGGSITISGANEGIYVQQLDDGSYIVVGNTEAGTGQQSNVYINTVTSAGVAGVTAITMGGAYDDRVTCVRQTSDGGFVLVGHKYNGINSKSGYDVWVVKLTPALSVHWDYTFGGDKNDFGESINQTDDGGYIITGSTNSYGKQSEIILLKIQADGTIEEAE